MRPVSRFTMVTAVAVGAITASSAAPASAASPPDPAPVGTVVNGGFETAGTGVPGWSVTESAPTVTVTTDARTGAAALDVRYSAAGTATVGQVLEGVPAGTYSVSAYARGTGLVESSVAAGDTTWERTGVPAIAEWTPVVIPNVTVSSGELEIRVESAGASGQWMQLDDITLSSTDPADRFLRGGDLTELSYVESMGGVFRDETGAERDAVELMAERGVDLARLRVYNATGPAHHRIGYPDSYLPEGFQDPDDVLALARRASAAGMKIQLTFHYSDYWSNGLIQDIPLEWRDVTALPDAEAVSALETHVHDYTADFLQQMSAQGTPPEFVSIGNEIQGGILFPYGTSADFETLSRFLTAGADAVHETIPGAKVIMHLDDAGNDDKYNWFFGELQERSVPVDVIGSSYYPFWTEKDIPTASAFFERVGARFDRPVMIMETGINWSPVTADGVTGQLLDNGPVAYEQTPEGQRDFLRELFAAMKALPPGLMLGDLYWDPVMIAAPGVGWEVGAANVVSNTTLFDFEGRALPAFQAYRENAPTPRVADGTDPGTVPPGTVPPGTVPPGSPDGTSDDAPVLAATGSDISAASWGAVLLAAGLVLVLRRRARASRIVESPSGRGGTT